LRLIDASPRMINSGCSSACIDVGIELEFILTL